MNRRIIVLPEELEVIDSRLKNIEQELKKEQRLVDDPILGTEGVMNLLNVSRRSLQNWRDQGIIEFSAINGKFYYRMSAINKMLERHMQKHEQVKN